MMNIANHLKYNGVDCIGFGDDGEFLDCINYRLYNVLEHGGPIVGGLKRRRGGSGTHRITIRTPYFLSKTIDKEESQRVLDLLKEENFVVDSIDTQIKIENQGHTNKGYIIKKVEYPLAPGMSSEQSILLTIAEFQIPKEYQGEFKEALNSKKNQKKLEFFKD